MSFQQVNTYFIFYQSNTVDAIKMHKKFTKTC